MRDGDLFCKKGNCFQRPRQANSDGPFKVDDVFVIPEVGNASYLDLECGCGQKPIKIENENLFTCLHSKIEASLYDHIGDYYQIMPGVSWRFTGQMIEIDFEISPFFTANDIKVEIKDGELRIKAEKERESEYRLEDLYSKSEHEREQKYILPLRWIEKLCKCNINIQSIQSPGMIKFRNNKMHIRFIAD